MRPSADSAPRREVRILERDGEPAGYVASGIEAFGGALVVTAFEVRPGVSWREAWTAALAPLFEAGDALAAGTPAGRCIALSFWLLGRDHPLYRVVHFQERDDGYALYARVSDVPAFLRAVTPALERRLAVSACAGHTGSLTLGFYRAGVRLAFERGKVTAIEPWTVDVDVRGIEFGRPSSDPRRPLAMFPDLTFLAAPVRLPRAGRDRGRLPRLHRPHRRGARRPRGALPEGAVERVAGGLSPAQAELASPGMIREPGNRRRTSGATRIFDDRLPLPRMIQSWAMTCSST